MSSTCGDVDMIRDSRSSRARGQHACRIPHVMHANDIATCAGYFSSDRTANICSDPAPHIPRHLPRGWHFRCSVAPPGSVPSSGEQRAGVKRVHMIAGVSVSSARARFQRLRARSQRRECRGAGSFEEPLPASDLSGAPFERAAQLWAGLYLILI